MAKARLDDYIKLIQSLTILYLFVEVGRRESEEDQQDIRGNIGKTYALSSVHFFAHGFSS